MDEEFESTDKENMQPDIKEGVPEVQKEQFVKLLARFMR